MKASQKFYEKTYTGKNPPKMAKDFLGRISHSLKKYELYREDVVFNLLNKGDKFLDIGCGEGNLTLKALAKFQTVYGVDIARTRLAIAEGRKNRLSKFKKNRLKFVVADADDHLPFKNSSFDAVTMVATLEHFFDPYQVIKEISRILKKSGNLIIEVPNLGFLPRRLEVLLGRLPVTSHDEAGWDGGHLHYLTLSSLKNFLEKFGFTIEKVTCSGIFAGFRSFWVSLLGPDIILKAKKIK